MNGPLLIGVIMWQSRWTEAKDIHPCGQGSMFLSTEHARTRILPMMKYNVSDKHGSHFPPKQQVSNIDWEDL
jgi:hypothetical protein